MKGLKSLHVHNLFCCTACGSSNQLRTSSLTLNDCCQSLPQAGVPCTSPYWCGVCNPSSGIGVHMYPFSTSLIQQTEGSPQWASICDLTTASCRINYTVLYPHAILISIPFTSLSYLFPASRLTVLFSLSPFRSLSLFTYNILLLKLLFFFSSTC